MKKCRMFGMAVSAIMMCLNLVSCNESEIVGSPVIEDEKTYEVSLNLGGEYVDVTETPLSRADTPKKFYAVNVYCIKADGTEDYYSNYAFGVFDNIESMKITLLGGYKYKFECTSATEGEDRFCLSDYSLNWLEKYVDLERMNIFVTEDSYFPNLHSGYTRCINDLRGDTDSYYPRMDRYYGVLSDYVPTDGGTVTISMKRCAFGVKMVINGAPDGKLSWRNIKTFIYGSESTYLTLTPNSHTGAEKLEFSTLYTFYEVGACWEKAVAGEVYSKQMTIEFTWERANGYKQEFSREFTVRRNVMTNLNVTLSGGSGEVSVGLDEEDAEMTEEYVNVDYDGGNTNDTEVNPVE